MFFGTPRANGSRRRDMKCVKCVRPMRSSAVSSMKALIGEQPVVQGAEPICHLLPIAPSTCCALFTDDNGGIRDDLHAFGKSGLIREKFDVGPDKSGHN